MKRFLKYAGMVLCALLLLVSFSWLGYRVYQNYYTASVMAAVQDGDLIFQTCKSVVGVVIRDATESKYDHVGIVVRRADGWFVYEAIEPVVFTPLPNWIGRGVLSRVELRRLKDRSPLLDPKKRTAFTEAMDHYCGRHYDYLLGWSDESLYCSELVWKVFDSALGIALSTPRHFKDFNLTKATVKLYIDKLFNGHPPLEETVVSPQDLLDSPLLTPVSIH